MMPNADLEYNAIVSQMAVKLREAWAANRGNKYRMTLEETLDFSKDVARQSGELCKYQALRKKLSLFRKKVISDSGNVTISTKENE